MDCDGEVSHQRRTNTLRPEFRQQLSQSFGRTIEDWQQHQLDVLGQLKFLPAGGVQRGQPHNPEHDGFNCAEGKHRAEPFGHQCKFQRVSAHHWQRRQPEDESPPPNRRETRSYRVGEL